MKKTKQEMFQILLSNRRVIDKGADCLYDLILKRSFEALWRFGEKNGIQTYSITKDENPCSPEELKATRERIMKN